MISNTFRASLLASTVIVGAMAAVPAAAQSAPPAAAAAADESVIFVTGSRIRQPNLESASPVTVVSAQEIAQTGTTRVEDLVNSLPQVFAGQGGNVSNGATGTATLNLRGLGSERTLVLVNGRRVVPGDPSSSAADLNVIPSALIERIDVLTGGASSVYGADAVSGVANFVLNTDFEGFKIDSQISAYNHNNRNSTDYTVPLIARNFPYPTGSVTDGETYDISGTFGAGFDDGRGHVTAYVGYRKIEAVLQSSRDYSACSLSARTRAQVDANGQLYTCGGSLTSPTGTVFAFDSDQFTSSFTSATLQFGANRALLAGGTRYNFAPLNYYQRPDERYTAGAFADYEISEALHPYMEFMFMDDRTVAQIAPSGNFGNTLSLNCDNPLLGAAQSAVICDTENLLVSPNPGDAFFVVGNVAAENAARLARNIGEPQLGTTPFNFIDPTTGLTYNRGFAQILRRNVEGGGRQDDLQHTSFRAVLGTKGELGSAWSYDAYYQYGRTNYAQTYLNDFSVSRLTRALDVVAGPNGTPVCRSALSGADTNCVPWDIFSPGTVTPSAASTSYLGTPGFTRGVVSQQVLSGFASGELGQYGIQTPWSDDGAGIVIGAEYRKEKLEFQSDVAFQTGDLAGQGAPTLPVNGQFDVKEVFTEISLPIARDSFVHDFTITGGYRYSDYSTGATTDTFKIEAELAPTSDFRLRGGYNRAVRAPTVQDLFAPQRVALDGSSDPCAGSPITASQAGCLAQGLTVGQTVAANPADQYNGLVGGNPALLPETADTYTVGLVLTPGVLPGFSASVDYFNIKVSDAIQGIGSDTIVAACTATADPTYCALVNRDASGSLWRSSGGFINNLSQNIGGVKTSGIDINVNYRKDVGDLGRASFSFVGTWLNELVTDTGVDVPGADQTYDCVGLYGNACGAPTPEWRHQARVGFDMPSGLGASLRWRYFEGTTLDALVTNTNFTNTSATGPNPGGVVRPANAAVGSVSYFDLSLTYELLETATFTVGANNLLDTAPPTVGSQSCGAGCNGNTFAQVYDALGRYLYASVSLEF